MSVYRWSYSSPGIIFVNGYEGMYDMLIPIDIDNPQFIIFADWLLKGGVVEPASAPSWWPFPLPDNTIPYTTEELEQAVHDAYLGKSARK